MLEQKQVPNQFNTSSREDAFKMLELLLANGYECSICTDCEGVYMIFYDCPQCGGCRLEWIDPEYEFVKEYEYAENADV